MEERMMRIHDRERDADDDEGSGMDEKELDMDNYMILDSVGTVDGLQFPIGKSKLWHEFK